MTAPTEYDHLVVDDTLAVPLTELRYEFSRSGGPGGQNVNKVNTKVGLRWNVEASEGLTELQKQRFLRRFGNRVNREGDLLVVSQEHRTQGRNRDECLEKLRAMLEEISRPPKTRKRTKPSRGSHRRRLKAKRERSERKKLRKPPSMGD